MTALDDLSEEDRRALFRCGELRALKAGDVLFASGEPARQFAFVESGRLEVVLDGGVQVAVLIEGEEVGAMGVVSGEERSATVRAIEDARVLVLDGDVLLGTDDASSDRGWTESGRARLMARLIREYSDRVRAGNASQLAYVEAVAREQRARLQLGSFLAYVVALMCLYGLTMRAGMGLSDDAAGTTRYTILVLLMFVGGLYWFIRRSDEPMETFGLVWRGGWKVAGQALLWSLPFIALLVALKWIAVTTVPAFDGTPIFSGELLRADRPLDVVPWMLAYAAFCPAQEFVARGALQGSLQRFLGGDRVEIKSNLLANLMFSASHAHVSPGLSILVLIPGVYWGWMFARQRSLVGVTLSHVLIGVFFLFFLGFPGLA